MSWKADLYEPHQYLPVGLDPAKKEQLRERGGLVGVASSWLPPCPYGHYKGPLCFQGRRSISFLHHFRENNTSFSFSTSLSLVVFLYFTYLFVGSLSIDLSSAYLYQFASYQDLEKYKRAGTKLGKALHSCRKFRLYSLEMEAPGT